MLSPHNYNTAPGYGQTAELHALMAHGASMGISQGVSSLLDELAEVKPTLLYAVPQLFKKVCDAIHAKVFTRMLSGVHECGFDRSAKVDRCGLFWDHDFVRVAAGTSFRVGCVRPHPASPPCTMRLLWVNIDG